MQLYSNLILDIDDALHSKKLENGNYEVGVHIADVGHFIKVSLCIYTV